MFYLFFTKFILQFDLSLGKQWLLWTVMMGWRWRSFFLRDILVHTASLWLTHNALQVWAQAVLIISECSIWTGLITRLWSAGVNYCSRDNGGCSHLCLPRPGGFTCRCPDARDVCVEQDQNFWAYSRHWGLKREGFVFLIPRIQIINTAGMHPIESYRIC